MKKNFLFLIILTAVFINGFSQSSAWHTYTFKDGHFSISFPGKPEESVQYDSSGASILKMNMQTYTIGDNTVFMSSWTDMSALSLSDKSIKQLLEDSRDGAVQSLQATNVVTTATVLTGEPYIEFAFSTEEFTGKDRIYFINKVQYSIITIFSAKDGLSPDADKFITSFKHS